MAEARRGRAHTVLLADDDDDYLHAMTQLLRVEGYCVIVASNGAEALAHALHDPPDIVLLDERMPGLSGTQVNRALAAAGIQRPVVLISGRDDSRFPRSAPHYWLPKPFEVEQLLETIEQALADARST